MAVTEVKAVYESWAKKEAAGLYCVYGPETLRVREFLKKLQSTLENAAADIGNFSWQKMDASEGLSCADIADEAKSLSFGVTSKCVIVRDAQLLESKKDAYGFEELIQEMALPQTPLADLPWVIVLCMKDLDRRKKVTKKLLEKAVVIECAEIPEADRGRWIQLLAKKYECKLSEVDLSQLLALDPWSLERVEREIEILLLNQLENPTSENKTSESGIMTALRWDSHDFVDAYFERKQTLLRAYLEDLKDRPEDAIPLIGLLTWNLKQFVEDANVRRPPFVVQKLRRWKNVWTTELLKEAHEKLIEADFSLKQTQRVPLGILQSLLPP